LSDIQKHIFDFYKTLFESQSNKMAKLDIHIQFWEDKLLLSDMDKQYISISFTQEELKIAVFRSNWI
jgi:hypothetical protein